MSESREDEAWHTSQADVFEQVADAFRTLAETLVRALGVRAPARRRPRRVTKKITKRGGYFRHDSLGSMLTKERRE